MSLLASMGNAMAGLYAANSQNQTNYQALNYQSALNAYASNNILSGNSTGILSLGLISSGVTIKPAVSDDPVAWLRGRVKETMWSAS